MAERNLKQDYRRKKNTKSTKDAKDTKNAGKSTRSSVKKNTDDKQKGKMGSAQHVRDVNSREIFRNEKLVCQFLRDYTDISIFSDIRPEDIEDVTEKYRAYLGVEFDTDTVKKVRVSIGNEQREVFVIPLIEHKSRVDYDVQMQLLRYMSVIWYDYGKQQDKLAEQSANLKKGSKRQRHPVTSRKSFRYPLIIPIVYYEGAGNWTADMSLWKRIELGEEMRAYIPDFSYKVVRIHDYTNEELRKHGDVMSLLLMFNRIQSPEDYSEFIRDSKEYLSKVLADTPQELMDVLLDVFWALLMKMNVPQEEAQELVENMGVKEVGYLFENAEKMDIQAERRNTKEARERAEAAEKRAKTAEERAETAEKKVETAEKKVETAEKKVETAEKELESTKAKIGTMGASLRNMMGKLAGICKTEGLTKEETRNRLHDFYQVDESDLETYFEDVWKAAMV